MKILRVAVLVGTLIGSVAIAVPAAEVDIVSEVDLPKYIGRWYQAYGNAFTLDTVTPGATCITADYTLDEAASRILVTNADRFLSPTGDLNTITGYAYVVDESEPGKLKVHLGNVPVDGDYWIAALGPKTFGDDGAYEWSIVTGSRGLLLFVLCRDMKTFEELYEKDVLAIVKDLGFTGPVTKPVKVVQEGCLPFTPTTVDTFEGDVQDVIADFGESVVTPPSTVNSLDLSRYEGRWYQAYGSLSTNVLESGGACVTADYKINKDGTVGVTNSARSNGPDGEATVITGSAKVVDVSEPGKLSVHLGDMPFDAPYWVLAIGDSSKDDAYEWAIVSDPVRAFLFVLVRDIPSFTGTDTETHVLGLLKDYGFDKLWNAPIKTVQDGCTYDDSVASFGKSLASPTVSTLSVGGVHQDKPHATLKKKPKFGLHLEGPLHASCKVSWTFVDDCETVSKGLVSAAEGMSGFDNCNGGNKCGYSIGSVTHGGVDFVHETSVAHYLDNINIAWKAKGTSCEAIGKSSSQTWYAVLDNGVNYCNLYNLVEASGLDYEESGVSDEVCTQYTTADCERY